MDGRTDGLMEIHPCVLQDIGPLGPLPKKCSPSPIGPLPCFHLLTIMHSREEGTADHTLPLGNRFGSGPHRADIM